MSHDLLNQDWNVCMWKVDQQPETQTRASVSLEAAQAYVDGYVELLLLEASEGIIQLLVNDNAVDAGLPVNGEFSDWLRRNFPEISDFALHGHFLGNIIMLRGSALWD